MSGEKTVILISPQSQPNGTLSNCGTLTNGVTRRENNLYQSPFVRQVSTMVKSEEARLQANRIGLQRSNTIAGNPRNGGRFGEDSMRANLYDNGTSLSRSNSFSRPHVCIEFTSMIWP